MKSLLPASKPDDAKKQDVPKPETEPSKPKGESTPAKTPDKGKSGAGTKIILHKIAFGDMGVGVIIQKVKLIGEISFEPSIGLISFDDIQRDVFNTREDLTGGECVACIVEAVAKKVFK